MIFSNISTFVKFLIKILPEISLVGSLFTNNPDITANNTRVVRLPYFLPLLETPKLLCPTLRFGHTLLLYL